MHETTLALSLVDLITETAAREGSQRVLRATVEIGALSHVEPEALAQAFSVAVINTVAADAALEIERPPGQASCLNCGESVSLAMRGDACPLCGSFKLLVTEGDGMRLKHLEIV